MTTQTTLRLRKKVTLFIFPITQSRVIQFCQFLAETYAREFVTNTVCTAHRISFYMFVLYLVKTTNDFYGNHTNYNSNFLH